MAACVLSFSGPELGPALRREELEIDCGSFEWASIERFLAAEGVERHHLAAALHELHATVDQGGSALLRVHHGRGGAEVEVGAPERQVALELS